jgi:hypothetical protein
MEAASSRPLGGIIKSAVSVKPLRPSSLRKPEMGVATSFSRRAEGTGDAEMK